MTQRPFRAALLAGALVIVAACSTTPPTGSPGTSGSPGASGTPSTGGIQHKTGASDLILRLDEGGGLMAPGSIVTEAPPFSLYGDGTAIFRDPTAALPPAAGKIIRSQPFFVARLTEEQVQTLLQFAGGQGGLAIAKERYDLPFADAPTTVFTIDAGGLRKTVSVNALAMGLDRAGNADRATLNQLASLRERLLGFAAAVGGEQLWSPDRYRGVLIDNEFVGAQAADAVGWPWPSIAPAAFVRPSDPSGSGFPTRVLGPADVAALGVDHLEGGALGFIFLSPATTKPQVVYGFGLRVLLPDEAS